MPEAGDRSVHGNVEFHPQYFERAIAEALDAEAGVAFLHSHPRGAGWQGLSDDDFDTESGIAGAIKSATGLPLVGMTLSGGDQTWSARFWEKNRSGKFVLVDSDSVRVVGEGLRMSFNPDQLPPPKRITELRRTIEAWGEKAQADLSRLHVGVVGAGSVGSVVLEALARVGIQRVRVLDFDRVEQHNRDRMLHATSEDARDHKPKVQVLAESIPRSATAERFVFDPRDLSVCEESGYRSVLDCDVIFSCVDRPWARSVLNFIAYAHLIPVIDGGIAVSRFTNGSMRSADWRAHVAGPGGRCLKCLGQYDPALVATEREGLLEDPKYIEQLPADHVFRSNQNVFVFSVAAASLELLQLVLMSVRPNGVASVGAQSYTFPASSVEFDTRDCDAGCLYPPLEARGERGGHPGTGQHQAAINARKSRASE
jgi:molybdopterin/thiamine biosynthesis adenylyltransferase